MTVYNADAGEARRDDWGTPDWLYEWCSVVWGPFDLDVAADATNTKCGTFYTEKLDGLLRPWRGSNWCNPPFSHAAEFAERAALMAQRSLNSVLVLPDATSASWFHSHVFLGASELVFLRGRVPFVLDGKELTGNNVGTVLAYYARRSCLAWMPVLATADTQGIKRGDFPHILPPRQLGIFDG